MRIRPHLLILLLIISLASAALAGCSVISPAAPTVVVPTPQPSPTSLFPEPTAEPTPTLALELPTSAPTQPQPVTIDDGDRAFFNGDWDTAIDIYSGTLAASSNPEIAAAAEYGLGLTYKAMGDTNLALDHLRALVNQHPESDQAKYGWFLLGEIYADLYRLDEADDAYTQALAQFSGTIDTYILERLGFNHLAAANYPAAIEDFQAALASEHLPGSLNLDIQIGNAYFNQENYPTAITVYQDVLNRTNNEYIKTQMLYQLGQAHYSLGDAEQGSQFLQQALNYPYTYYAYLALVDLVDLGQPVDELQRGIIDYYMGQHNVAIAAFVRYYQTMPAEHPDSIHYFYGLSLRAVDESWAAIDEWNELIATHPEGDYFDDAYEEKAYTLWAWLDEYQLAIDTLLEFVNNYPLHPRAAEFLYDAGRAAERSGDLALAADFWLRLKNEYPGSSYSYDAAFNAGIVSYRAGDTATALAAFQAAVSLGENAEQVSGGKFWLGKTYIALGDTDNANSFLLQAANLDPTGYYSERSRDMLEFAEPFTSPGTIDWASSVEASKPAADSWMRLTFGLPNTLDLSGPGSLTANKQFIRGNILWKLGLFEDARLEFEDLRFSILNDPELNYRLSYHLYDLGLYRSAIFCARHVLDTALLSDAETLHAPDYFNFIRFGLYYQDIIRDNLVIYKLDPLTYYSMMRQESLFEGFVSSGAGARGLMQIMPATGESVANKLSWPQPFSADDLYRPAVSVTLGADYLSGLINYFDGEIYPALAGYNAGPGNAAIWWDLANGDTDLFVEIIRYKETRTYIKHIYEIFSIYQDVYSGLE